MKKHLAFITLLLACAGAAFASNVPNMIRDAIRVGHAHGAVDGPIADQTRLKLNATGPLTLDVEKVYDFEQPECARLRLNFKQADTLPPGAAMPSDYAWATEMNVCQSGEPPTSLKRKAR